MEKTSTFLGSEMFVGNKRTKELHLESCWCVNRMSKKNKMPFVNIKNALDLGYDACGHCMPLETLKKILRRSAKLNITAQTDEKLQVVVGVPKWMVTMTAEEVERAHYRLNLAINGKFLAAEMLLREDERHQVNFTSSKNLFTEEELQAIFTGRLQLLEKIPADHACPLHIRALYALINQVEMSAPNYLPKNTKISYPSHVPEMTRSSSVDDPNARRPGPCIYIGERWQAKFDLASGKKVVRWAIVGGEDGQGDTGCAGDDAIGFSGWTYAALDHDAVNSHIKELIDGDRIDKTCKKVALNYFGAESPESENDFLEEMRQILNDITDAFLSAVFAMYPLVLTVDQMIGYLRQLKAEYLDRLDHCESESESESENESDWRDKKVGEFIAYLKLRYGFDYSLGGLGPNGIDEFVPAASGYLWGNEWDAASEYVGIEDDLENEETLVEGGGYKSDLCRQYGEGDAFHYFLVHEGEKGTDKMVFEFAVKSACFLYLIITKSQRIAVFNGGQPVTAKRIRTLCKGTNGGKTGPIDIESDQHYTVIWDGRADTTKKDELGDIAPAGEYFAIIQAIAKDDKDAAKPTDRALSSHYLKFNKMISCDGYFPLIETLVSCFNQLIKESVVQTKQDIVELTKLFERLETYVDLDVYLNYEFADVSWDNFLVWFMDVFVLKKTAQYSPQAIKKYQKIVSEAILSYLRQGESSMLSATWQRRILTDITRTKLDQLYRAWTLSQCRQSFDLLGVIAPLECALARQSKLMARVDVGTQQMEAASFKQRKALIELLLSDLVTLDDWRRVLMILGVTQHDGSADDYQALVESCSKRIYGDLPITLLPVFLPYLPATAAIEMALCRQSKQILLEYVTTSQLKSATVNLRASLVKLLCDKVVVGLAAEEMMIAMLKLTWQEGKEAAAQKLASLSGGRDEWYRRIQFKNPREQLKLYLPYLVECWRCGGDGKILDILKPRDCGNCDGTGTLNKKVACSNCLGFKKVFDKEMETCPRCGGNGNIIVFGKKKQCPRCEGSKKIAKNVLVTCKTCNGKGYLYQDKKCLICGGDGKVGGGFAPLTCPICHGDKRIQKL